MEGLPCVSMWQPWATLLVHGAKKIETRSWAFPARFRLPCVMAIHAAQKWDDDLYGLCFTDPFNLALIGCGVEVDFERDKRVRPHGLPFGCVVGLVRVAECCDTVGLASTHGPYPPRADATERAFGDYSPRRFGWVCDRFHVLAEPIALRGLQSIWMWDAPEHVLTLAQNMREQS